jgi:cytochrome oxidase Cu insertion factor (SCO1/SenC/PrrC family)
MYSRPLKNARNFNSTGAAHRFVIPAVILLFGATIGCANTGSDGRDQAETSDPRTDVEVPAAFSDDSGAPATWTDPPQERQRVKTSFKSE